MMKIGYSYHGNTFFDHFKRDVEEMKKAGASYLVQTFSENNMEYNFDNFYNMNNYAQEMGLEVHMDPWSLAGIFGGEAYSRFLLENPQVWQRNNQGEKLPLACLNHPDTVDFVRKWIDIVSQLSVDYIFWDEPHFFIQVDPESPIWGCRCPVCQEKFFSENGYEIPEKKSNQIEQFKKDSIKSFLQEMITFSTKKEIKNGLCVLPPARDEDFSEYWRGLIRDLKLDYFGTDPYWLGWKRSIEEMLVPLTITVTRLCQEFKIDSQIWLQGFKINDSKIDEWEKGIDTIIASKPDYLGVWSYRCCNSLSYLDYNNSNKLWEILKKKVRDKR
ncbi:hypothetical protein [Natronospora cellulosivora (SeqCode)]